MTENLRQFAANFAEIFFDAEKKRSTLHSKLHVECIVAFVFNGFIAFSIFTGSGRSCADLSILLILTPPIARAATTPAAKKPEFVEKFIRVSSNQKSKTFAFVFYRAPIERRDYTCKYYLIAKAFSPRHNAGAWMNKPLYIASLLFASGMTVMSAESWPMFRGGPALLGVSASPDLPAHPKLLWTFKTAGPVKSSAAIADGRVVIGSNDGNIYALDLANGKKIWAFKTGGAVESSPLVLDGRVFVGSADDSLYALDAATGKLLWKYETGDKILGSPNWVKSGGTNWILDRQLRFQTALRERRRRQGRSGLMKAAITSTARRRSPTARPPSADATPCCTSFHSRTASKSRKWRRARMWQARSR